MRATIQASSARERVRIVVDALKIYADGARCAHEDAQTRKEGRRLVRLPDYSLIAGFIAPRAGGSAKSLGPLSSMDDMGRSIFLVYDDLLPSEAGLDFAVAFPTLCELAMSLQRRADGLGRIATTLQKDSAIYTKLMRVLDYSNPAQSSLGDLTADIKDVLDWLPAATKSEGLRRFRHMLQSKRIKGLGDIFTKTDYDQVKGEIALTARGLTSLLMKHRRRRDGEDPHSFELRNRIDALNFALGSRMKRVRTDTDLSFVAPLSPSVKGEQFQEALSNRTYPQTVLLALKAAQLYKGQMDAERQATGWLRAFGDAAAITLSYTEGITDFTHMPHEESQVVSGFFSRYGAFLELNLTGQREPSIASTISAKMPNQKSAADLFHAEKSETDGVLAELKAINLAAPAEELLVDFDLRKFKSLRRALSGNRR